MPTPEPPDAPEEAPWGGRNLPYLVGLGCVVVAWLRAWRDPGAGNSYDWAFFLVGAKALLHPKERLAYVSVTGLTPHRMLEADKYRVPGGVHLYHSAPYVQIGPLALLVAAALIALFHGWIHTSEAVGFLGDLLLVVAMGQLIWVRGVARRAAWTLMLGCALTAVVWTLTTLVYAHLDDALMIVALSGALRCVHRERYMWAGAMLGVAVGCKPVALLAVPVLLCISPLRARLWATGCFLGVAGAVWLPFVLGDSRTLGALGGYLVPVRPYSGLRLLGLSVGSHPAWARSAQLVLIALVAAGWWLWRRRRAVMAVQLGMELVFLGFMVRILTDPGAFPYYEAGVLVFAAALDASRAMLGERFSLGSVLRGARAMGGTLWLSLVLASLRRPTAAWLGGARIHISLGAVWVRVIVLIIGAALVLRPRRAGSAKE